MSNSKEKWVKERYPFIVILEIIKGKASKIKDNFIFLYLICSVYSLNYYIKLGTWVTAHSIDFNHLLGAKLSVNLIFLESDGIWNEIYAVVRIKGK